MCSCVCGRSMRYFKFRSIPRCLLSTILFPSMSQLLPATKQKASQPLGGDKWQRFSNASFLFAKSLYIQSTLLKYVWNIFISMHVLIFKFHSEAIWYAWKQKMQATDKCNIFFMRQQVARGQGLQASCRDDCFMVQYCTVQQPDSSCGLGHSHSLIVEQR